MVQIYEVGDVFVATDGAVEITAHTAIEAVGLLVLKAGLIPIVYGNGTRFRIPEEEMTGRQLQLAGAIWRAKDSKARSAAELSWNIENPDLVP